MRANLLIVCILTCFVYGIVIYCSFSDVIYLTELRSKSSVRLIETSLSQVPLWRSAICMIFGAILLQLYAAGYRALKGELNGAHQRRIIFTFGAVITVLALVAVPFDSTDVTVYINHGWVQVHYGLNPYAIAVGELQGWSNDSMLRQDWIQFPCPYGVLFAVLTAAISTIARDHYLLTVYLYKSINAAAHLALAAFIYSYVRRNYDQAAATRSCYLYLFCPFMLLHFVSNAHNDILLAFFTLAAFYLASRKKYLFVPLLCICGVAIKFVSLFILPAVLVLTFKQGGVKTFFASLAIALAPLTALCIYYFRGIDVRHIELFFEATINNYGSFQTLLKLLPQPLIGQSFAVVAWGGFIILSTVFFIRWCRERNQDRLFGLILRDSVVILALFICVISRHFNAWYIAMFLPLALLLPEQSKTRLFSIFAACTMLFSFTWFGFPNPFYAPLYLWAAFMMARLPLSAAPKESEPQLPLMKDQVGDMFGVS